MRTTELLLVLRYQKSKDKAKFRVRVALCDGRRFGTGHTRPGPTRLVPPRTRVQGVGSGVGGAANSSIHGACRKACRFHHEELPHCLTASLPFFDSFPGKRRQKRMHSILVKLHSQFWKSEQLQPNQPLAAPFSFFFLSSPQDPEAAQRRSYPPS